MKLATIDRAALVDVTGAFDYKHAEDTGNQFANAAGPFGAVVGSVVGAAAGIGVGAGVGGVFGGCLGYGAGWAVARQGGKLVGMAVDTYRQLRP
jgi:hypothetical protein